MKQLSISSVKALGIARDGHLKVGYVRQTIEQSLYLRGLIFLDDKNVWRLTQEGEAALADGYIPKFKRMPSEIYSPNPKYPIDKNIPLPDPPREYTRTAYGSPFRKYPWHHMEIGDSFFVGFDDPGHNWPARKVQTRIAATAHAYTHGVHGFGKKFTTRRLENGVRVWRIE